MARSKTSLAKTWQMFYQAFLAAFMPHPTITRDLSLLEVEKTRYRGWRRELEMLR